LEAGAYGVIAYAGVLILEVVHAQHSITLDMPMSYAYAAIPVGGILMCLFTLIRARQALTAEDKP
jgi:TRAP-type C4-dicarboxylate transport system permease small subunit